MIFAGIKNGLMISTTNIPDPNAVEANLIAGPNATGFDHFVRIDNISPMPDVGWTYNVSTGFAAPVMPPITPLTTNQLNVIKAMNAQQMGSMVMAQIYAINEANLTSGALTSSQFTAMLADQNLLNIERLLWNGSLATALAMIQVLPTTYFSTGNIATIVTMIQNSGLT
jgi:hypothetical protein